LSFYIFPWFLTNYIQIKLSGLFHIKFIFAMPVYDFIFPTDSPTPSYDARPPKCIAVDRQTLEISAAEADYNRKCEMIAIKTKYLEDHEQKLVEMERNLKAREELIIVREKFRTNPGRNAFESAHQHTSSPPPLELIIRNVPRASQASDRKESEAVECNRYGKEAITLDQSRLHPIPMKKTCPAQVAILEQHRHHMAMLEQQQLAVNFELQRRQEAAKADQWNRQLKDGYANGILPEHIGNLYKERLSAHYRQPSKGPQQYRAKMLPWMVQPQRVWSHSHGLQKLSEYVDAPYPKNIAMEPIDCDLVQPLYTKENTNRSGCDVGKIPSASSPCGDVQRTKFKQNMSTGEVFTMQELHDSEAGGQKITYDEKLEPYRYNNHDNECQTMILNVKKRGRPKGSKNENKGLKTAHTEQLTVSLRETYSDKTNSDLRDLSHQEECNTIFNPESRRIQYIQNPVESSTNFNQNYELPVPNGLVAYRSIPVTHHGVCEAGVTSLTTKQRKREEELRYQADDRILPIVSTLANVRTVIACRNANIQAPCSTSLNLNCEKALDTSFDTTAHGGMHNQVRRLIESAQQPASNLMPPLSPLVACTPDDSRLRRWRMAASQEVDPAFRSGEYIPSINEQEANEHCDKTRRFYGMLPAEPGSFKRYSDDTSRTTTCTVIQRPGNAKYTTENFLPDGPTYPPTILGGIKGWVEQKLSGCNGQEVEL